jgi:organic hydroperoxide reductase OsmC/OhrA
MGTYTASIVWNRGDQPFVDGKYRRTHLWRFDGGAEVAGSAAPAYVRPPLSDESAIDPEEALVAAASSCHMLYFLDFARRAGFCIDSYEDDARATVERGIDGRSAVTGIVLRPRIAFCGQKLPRMEELDALHEKAHDACIIANSLKCEVRIEPYAAIISAVGNTATNS